MARRSGTRGATILMAVSLLFAACGSSPDPDLLGPSDGVDQSDATARPSSGLFGPKGSFEPIDVALSEGLPRSAEFLGVRFTVDAAHVTNTHPYTIFGDPTPGEQLFVVLDVTAENTSAEPTRYVFNDEAFGLRTYSGQLLPIVGPIGTYDFSRLEPGERASDQVVFGTRSADVLDGAALLIGRPPDSPTVLALTAPQRGPLYPIDVVAIPARPVQAGTISWSVSDGEASLEAPDGVCCPETGARADDGELFINLTVRGTVRGSRYGQASVTSKLVRLVADGQSTEPFGFKGQANVKEGEAYEFDVTWIIPRDTSRLALEVGTGTPDVRTIELSIGLPVPSPEPYLTPQPSASTSPEPSTSGSPGASGSPTPSSSTSPTTSPSVSASTNPTTTPGVSASPTLTASPPPITP